MRACGKSYSHRPVTEFDLKYDGGEWRLPCGRPELRAGVSQVRSWWVAGPGSGTRAAKTLGQKDEGVGNQAGASGLHGGRVDQCRGSGEGDGSAGLAGAEPVCPTTLPGGR